MVAIKDNRKKEHIFEDLVSGEYFVYKDDLYVVIDECVETENVCDDYYDSDVMNALNLKNGFLYRIASQEVVEPVDVEITFS